MKSLIFVFLINFAIYANIISDAGGGVRTIVETKDYFRAIVAYEDDNSFPVNLHCRLFRYSEPRKQIPLVVFFIAWGSTIEKTEGYLQYENILNDPFLALVIMPKKDNVDYNTNNWYWGNVFNANNSKRSVPWTHNGVIKLLNDIKSGTLDSILMGNTIDTNRIYGFGHSIGGTATAQICSKHPEIFAAFHSHSGWTRYWSETNMFFSDRRGCLIFSDLIGGKNLDTSCIVDSSVLIQGNADQQYLPLDSTFFPAWKYTDLNWYFGKTGNSWNYRDPSFPAPFAFHTTGSRDDPENQGDNLISALDAAKRGFMFYRVDAGHPAGGVFVKWNWLRNFRKNQSYLAFTKRDYDDFGGFNGVTYSGHGMLNDLEKHGWDPATIIDSLNYYSVKLTGRGTADVTLHRLQQLDHRPGTNYSLLIDKKNVGAITADVLGIITIPAVKDSAVIELRVTTDPVQTKELYKVNKSSSYSIVKQKGFIIKLTHSYLQRKLTYVAVYTLSGKKVCSLKPANETIMTDRSEVTFDLRPLALSKQTYFLQFHDRNNFIVKSENITFGY